MFIAPVRRAISIYLEPCVADYFAIRRQVRFIGDIVSGISLKRYFSNIVGANVFVVDPVDMAIAIRNHCKSRTGGCEGCCFDRPTSDNGDGECVLGCPEDWEV